MDGRDRPAAQGRRIATGEVQDDPADRGAHLHALPGSPAGSAYLQYRGGSHRNCGCSDSVFDGGIPAGGLAGAEAVAKRPSTPKYRRALDFILPVGAPCLDFAWCTLTIRPLLKDAGIAQLVEHDLAKVGVASSSLVSRSKFK